MEPVLASGLCHVIVRKNIVGVRDASTPHVHTYIHLMRLVSMARNQTYACD